MVSQGILIEMAVEVKTGQRHLLSATDFYPGELENRLFPLTDILKEMMGPRLRKLNLLNDDYAVMVFMEEPSTRTGPSMARAAQLLNAHHELITNADTASGLAKREPRPSVARMWEAQGYNMVAWRAAQENVFDAIVQDPYLNFDLINLGDGPGEHPTQFLLDAYTMREKRKEQGLEMADMTIVIAGMPISRVTQSWMTGFATEYPNRNITFHLVSHPDLVPSNEKIDDLERNGITVVQSDNLIEAVKDPRVAFICGTRYQAQHDPRYAHVSDLDERIKIAREGYALHKSDLSAEVLDTMPKTAYYLHPLPQGPEFPEDLHYHPQVLAFTEQAKNGTYTRAALILDRADPQKASELLAERGYL